MKKTFITYGKRIEKSKFQEARLGKIGLFLNKPDGGLWASPVDSDWGWKDWCLSENFREEQLKTSTKFSLKDNARILKIDSLNDFKNVLDRYGNFINSKIRYINWDILKESWDAVLLTDKGNHECHLPMDGSMENLNTWDCESIVILRWDIIDESSIKYKEKEK